MSGLRDRIDIFEIEQFVALNLYELGSSPPTAARRGHRYGEAV